MGKIDINRSLKPEKIGLCFKGRSEHERFAFIEFKNKVRFVSTIPFYEGEGLTIGDYFEGRISDYKYCVKNNDEASLNTEFEAWTDEFHREDYTSEYGVEKL